MLFNPDDGLTREQINAKVWQELPPEMKARCRKVMDEKGLTWEQLCQVSRDYAEKELPKAQETPHTRSLNGWSLPRVRLAETHG